MLEYGTFMKKAASVIETAFNHKCQIFNRILVGISLQNMASRKPSSSFED